jgi:hypothetical protein
MGLHSMSTLDSRLVMMLKQLNKYLNHFPRSEKYGLSLQIRTAAYEVYGLVVEAQKRHHKKTALSALDIRHEQLRMFVRLAHELGYFQFKDGTRINDNAEATAERRHHALSDSGTDQLCSSFDPARSVSICNSLIWDSDKFSPVFRNHGSSINCYCDIRSLVSRLSAMLCPYAVVWRVRSIVVNSLNGVPGTFWFAHVACK